MYVGDSDGAPVFRALGHLKTDEVADVVQVTKVRVLGVLERRGVVRVEPEALQVDEAFAARDPVLEVEWSCGPWFTTRTASSDSCAIKVSGRRRHPCLPRERRPTTAGWPASGHRPSKSSSPTRDRPPAGQRDDSALRPLDVARLSLPPRSVPAHPSASRSILPSKRGLPPPAKPL